MISTICTLYVDDQHHLYNIAAHHVLKQLVIMDRLSIVYHHSHHQQPFVNGHHHHHLAGRKGLLCCVGGQLTNMQPIRTRKFDDSVVDDADGDDDDDDDGDEDDDGDGDGEGKESGQRSYEFTGSGFYWSQKVLLEDQQMDEIYSY